MSFPRPGNYVQQTYSSTISHTKYALQTARKCPDFTVAVKDDTSLHVEFTAFIHKSGFDAYFKKCMTRQCSNSNSQSTSVLQ